MTEKFPDRRRTGLPGVAVGKRERAAVCNGEPRKLYISVVLQYLHCILSEGNTFLFIWGHRASRRLFVLKFAVV